MSDLIRQVGDFVRQHPYLTIALTHSVTSCIYIYSVSEGKPIKWITKKLFQAALAAVPASIVNNEQAKLRKDIEKGVIGHSLDDEVLYKELPAEGFSKDELVTILDKYSSKDEKKWNHGKVSGAVYHGGNDLTLVMTEAFKRYALSNPLHPDCFPYLRKMEAEVVSMTVNLFHGGPNACGTMTSGGTESILMAMKTYRDYGRTTRNITEPEIVVPITAHAAFDKACAYFGIKLRHIPVDPVTFRAVPSAMEAAINSNTVGLVVSAPSYPQGVIDPVEDVAVIARKYNIPLHVDCCLGSYCIAFAKQAGFSVPPFDFAVPGVTSISVDTHKYGFAPKGSSLVLYANETLRHAQYFVAPEWTGGIYASPTIAGSRPGALIAACWATLMSIGVKGYKESAERILKAAQTITAGIKEIDHITVYGKPDLSVVCFGPRKGDSINIYNVGDAMTARGWNLNIMQNPACIHICVTYANAGSAQLFLADLKDAVQDVVTAPPGKFKDGSGAIYGMAASIPDKSLVSQVAYGFLDALYQANRV